MIIEIEINGARVIVSGDNLSVSVTEVHERLHRVFGIPAVGTRSEHVEITEADIRSSLIARAKAHRDKAKASFSAMGIAAVGDSKFLSRVENPDIGFNIKTYQKMVEWLDAVESAERAAAPQAAE